MGKCSAMGKPIDLLDICPVATETSEAFLQKYGPEAVERFEEQSWGEGVHLSALDVVLETSCVVWEDDEWTEDLFDEDPNCFESIWMYPPAQTEDRLEVLKTLREISKGTGEDVRMLIKNGNIFKYIVKLHTEDACEARIPMDLRILKFIAEWSMEVLPPYYESIQKVVTQAGDLPDDVSKYLMDFVRCPTDDLINESPSVLLEIGCNHHDPDAPESCNLSHLAPERLTTLLLEAGADIDGTDDEGRTLERRLNDIIDCPKEYFVWDEEGNKQRARAILEICRRFRAKTHVSK